MKGSATVRALLFAFVGLSVATAVYRAAGRKGAVDSSGGAVASAKAVQAPEPAPAAAGKLAPYAPGTAIVYYFYTNTRCASCKALEAYTREAVSGGLAAGYKGWLVEFKGVNIEEKENYHFVRDYKLDSKSVIVQKYSDDKPLNWIKLDKVWTLLGDKEAFISYVGKETRGLLDKNER